jgi:hypothetical protein
MRNVTLAILALSVAGAATLAGSDAIAAHDYPYCIEDEISAFPHNCYYQSYAQCMASASGRAAECVVNPRVAFDRARRGQPGQPYRPYRYYDRY